MWAKKEAPVPLTTAKCLCCGISFTRNQKTPILKLTFTASQALLMPSGNVNGLYTVTPAVKAAPHI